MLANEAVLNLGSGKILPGEFQNCFLVNLDTCYYGGSEAKVIERAYERKWLSKKEPATFFCTEDAFTFLERTRIIFDTIVAYRFLEHIHPSKLLYLIHLMYECLRPKGRVIGLTPDYEILAKRILREDPFSPDFEKENIVTTTELLNEPNSPHCSIWTQKRAFYYFTYEGKFKLTSIESPFSYDGRNIYMKFIAERSTL